MIFVAIPLNECRICFTKRNNHQNCPIILPYAYPRRKQMFVGPLRGPHNFCNFVKIAKIKLQNCNNFCKIVAIASYKLDLYNCNSFANFAKIIVAILQKTIAKIIANIYFLQKFCKPTGSIFAKILQIFCKRYCKKLKK